MKIIQVHNYYQQAGGEDAVVKAEASLLRSNGNIVIEYYKSNDDIGVSSNRLLAISQLLKASLSTLWNHQTYREFRELLQSENPDVVHCHNTFPLISPSVYWACAKEKVPVVQTLHNYRLLCLNAFLFRQTKAVSHQPSANSPVPSPSGSICELCVSKRFKWQGIKYGCYRDSKAGSLVVALMLLLHEIIGTWSKKVTAYIALTEFQKQKMIEGGLPEDKIWVKPNFIQTLEEVITKETNFTTRSRCSLESTETGENKPALKPLSDPESSNECNEGGVENPYCLFVGRLSPEKGCDVLIRAWGVYQEELVANPMPQLLIVGDGPERDSLELLVTNNQHTATIHFLGKKPKNEVLKLMRDAHIFVFSSIWYETFGLTVLEAGLGETPAIVSAPTTTSGLIEDMKTGLLYPSGDEVVLAEKLEWAFDHPDELQGMGKAAEQNFKHNYSAEVNYSLLMDIYKTAKQSHNLRSNT